MFDRKGYGTSGDNLLGVTEPTGEDARGSDFDEPSDKVAL